MIESSKDYDYCLEKIGHYKKYPKMLPWVGNDYKKSKSKILLIAESHYLQKGETYHHDADEWYKGISLAGKTIGGITTREVIEKYVNKVKRRAYRIFINIGEALIASCLPTSSKDRYTVYENMAFMNFFQRPAEKNGKSINVKSIDITIANEVSKEVVKCIEPDIVIFTSVKAYKNAKDFRKFLDGEKIPYEKTPHPATSHWSKTGKGVFIAFICKHV